MFSIVNNTPTPLNTSCSPAEHYADCTPSKIAAKEIINQLNSVVMVSNAAQVVCTIQMHEHVSCAHGHCAYMINISKINPTQGYNAQQVGSKVIINKG